MNVPIRVAVRIRPILSTDTKQVSLLSVHHATSSSSSRSLPHIVTRVPGQATDSVFQFDDVFEPETTQHGIYERTVHELLQKWFGGVHCTLLAYGQTGSGKSYTLGIRYGMLRSLEISETTGIIPRALHDIFKHIREKMEAHARDGFNIECTCSFIEIINDDIRDLIAATDGYEIVLREEGNGEVNVSGATRLPVFTFTEAMEVLEKGLKYRKTAETNINEASSRSHAVFTLNLMQTILNESQLPDDVPKPTSFPITLTSKLHFVDLAGSERLKRTQAVGDRKKEGISINRDLLVLGKVVNALSVQTSSKNKFIIPPFRESKLTRFLQSSLGGSSRTVFITCVSPTEMDMGETVNALKYAMRARRIKNNCKVNATFGGYEKDNIYLEMERMKQKLESFQQQQERFLAIEAERDKMADEYRSILSRSTQMQTQLSHLQLWSQAVEAPTLDAEEEDAFKQIISQSQQMKEISIPVAIALAKHFIHPGEKTFTKLTEAITSSSSSSENGDSEKDGKNILEETFEDTSCPFDYIDEMAELKSAVEERDLIIQRLQCIVESMTDNSKLETLRHDSGLDEDEDDQFLKRLSNISMRAQQLLNK